MKTNLKSSHRSKSENWRRIHQLMAKSFSKEFWRKIDNIFEPVSLLLISKIPCQHGLSRVENEHKMFKMLPYTN